MKKKTHAAHLALFLPLYTISASDPMPAIAFLILRIAAAGFLLCFLGCILVTLFKDLDQVRSPAIHADGVTAPCEEKGEPHG